MFKFTEEVLDQTVIEAIREEYGCSLEEAKRVYGDWMQQAYPVDACD